MDIINLTPHNVDVYEEEAFINLEKLNATTWAADGVDPDGLIASFPSSGNVRIQTATKELEPIFGSIPCVRTFYGELEGIDMVDIGDSSILIVSLPTQSMSLQSGHYLAPQMASPYRVVRNRSNTSLVLGCMGLSFQ